MKHNLAQKLIGVFLMVSLTSVLKAQNIDIMNIHDAYNKINNNKVFDNSVRLKFSGLEENYTILNKTFPLEFQLNSDKPFKNELNFEGDIFHKATLDAPKFIVMNFVRCTFNESLSFYDDVAIHFNDLLFDECTFKKGLDMHTAVIDSNLTISGRMSGLLNLSYIKAKNSDVSIDLSDLKPLVGKKIMINLTGAPIAAIDFNYEDFELDTNIKDTHIITSIYSGLLLNYKTRGIPERYQLVDIEYQHFLNTHGTTWNRVYGLVKDWLQQYWWNYGYDKERIIWITMGALLFFTFINLFFYKTLNKEVYEVDEYNFKNTRNGFSNSLIYTAIVFFSFTIKLDKLKFDRRGYLLWFIIIYLFGIICIAYLANYVLKAGPPV